MTAVFHQRSLVSVMRMYSTLSRGDGHPDGLDKLAPDRQRLGSQPVLWNVPDAYRRSVECVKGELATSKRLTEELVEVSIGDVVVGFVESAGPVYVALHGPRYDRAVEVSQSLVFDVAAAALLAHVRVVDHLAAELAKPDSGTVPAQVA